MSDAKSTKATLLGELESIRGLLDEQDFDVDQIPTLVDDIPLLEEALDIDEDLEITGEFVVDDDFDTDADNPPLNEDDLTIPTLTDSDTLDTSEPLTEVAESNEFSPTPAHATEAALPDGVLPGQQSLFDTANNTTDEHDIENLEIQSDIHLTEVEQPAVNSGNEAENTTAAISPTQPEAPEAEINEEKDDLEALLKASYADFYPESDTDESALENQNSSEPPSTEDHEEADTDDATHAHDSDRETKPVTQHFNPAPEHDIVEQLLQNPFKNNADSIQQQAPHLAGLASTPQATTAENNTPSPPDHPQSRDENPFLPKHIRERLHSGRSLTDVLRKQSQPSHQQESQSITATLVDNLVAEYLPKIEAELRRRLTLVAEGKVSSPLQSFTGENSDSHEP